VKITVWGINFDPEPTGIGPFNTDLSVYLASKGHDVSMVSTFPYYPWWKKDKELHAKLRGKPFHRGVRLYRCWHYVPSKPSTVKRLVHEMSFLTTSVWRILTLPAPDVFIVVSPPLFLGIGAFLVSRILRRPFVFHVQDLQPDAALGLGMLKPGPAVRALYALEKWTYSSAALVTGICQGMMDMFTKKGVPAGKQYLFANWIPDNASPKNTPPSNSGAPASFRTANGIDPTTPLIAYSGNIGAKQGLEVVVESALLAQQAQLPAIHWAICGEGAAKPALQAMIPPTATGGVRLYPLQPDDLYHALLREADVCLITQQRGTGQFFFPSKLLSILQYGRPVLAVADASSELSRAVREGDFGLVVPSGDAKALLAASQTIVKASDDQRAAWAKNGKAWVDQFRRSRVLGAFETRLAAVASSRQ